MFELRPFYSSFEDPETKGNRTIGFRLFSNDLCGSHVSVLVGGKEFSVCHCCSTFSDYFSVITIVYLSPWRLSPPHLGVKYDLLGKGDLKGFMVEGHRILRPLLSPLLLDHSCQFPWCC